MNKEVVTLPTIEQRCDRYYRNRIWKAANKPTLDQIEEDAKYFRDSYSVADPAGTFWEHGEISSIMIGPKHVERTVSVAKALKLWGIRAMAKLLRISLGDLEKAKGDDAKQAITEARTGYRDLTAIPKQKGTDA